MYTLQPSTTWKHKSMYMLKYKENENEIHNV